MQFRAESTSVSHAGLFKLLALEAPLLGLRMIVELLPVLLNRPLFRAHYCKLYQDVGNLVATENRQKWRESTETHDTDSHHLAGKYLFQGVFYPTHRTVLKIDKKFFYVCNKM